MNKTKRLRDDLAFEAVVGGHALYFTSTWGLFSPKAIDEGTALLANFLRVLPGERCLDLGCGYGPLGLAMAKMGGSVEMVDKDFVAVSYAGRNASRNGLDAVAYLSNGLSAVAPDAKFDVIASNVPAKIGGELLSIMLEDCYAHLNPGGKLYVVTISGLRDYFKRHMTDQFGNYDKLKQSRSYTAAVAVRR